MQRVDPLRIARGAVGLRLRELVQLERPHVGAARLTKNKMLILNYLTRSPMLRLQILRKCADIDYSEREFAMVEVSQIGKHLVVQRGL